MDEQMSKDQSALQAALMRMIQECCQIMDDCGMNETAFASGAWSATFTKNPDFKTALS